MKPTPASPAGRHEHHQARERIAKLLIATAEAGADLRNAESAICAAKVIFYRATAEYEAALKAATK